MLRADPASIRSYVRGVSFWSPSLPSWEIASRAFRGEGPITDPPASRPAPALLAPTERRRAPDTVALAMEVGTRACESARIDPRTLPSVFACSHGDLAINDYMSSTLASSPELISPIKFHNSVHNAAAGYWTIGVGCTEPYTALSANDTTFGAGLLESLTQAACESRAVLLVAYDIEAKGPLATMVRSQGMLGAGLIVSPEPGDDPFAVVDWKLGHGSDVTPPRTSAAQCVASNAMAGCIPLFEALARGAPAVVRLPANQSLYLEMEIQPLRA